MILTTKLDVRLTAEERERLETLAALRGRSLGAEMRAALAAWIDSHGEAVWDAEG
jgi:plasmid stability protein